MSNYEDTLTLSQVQDTIKDVAKQTLKISQDAKTNDRKLGVIGGALIEQKGKIEDIAKSQMDNNELILDAVNNTLSSQKELTDSFSGATEDIESLLKSYKNQKDYVETLSQLQIQHTQLVKIHDESVSQSNKSLSELRAGISEIRNSIQGFDVQDQTQIIISHAKHISQRIDEHIDQRVANQADLQYKVSVLTEGMVELYDNIGSQTETISSIERLAKQGQVQAQTLSDKFDKLLGIQNIKKSQSEYRLEDLFSEPKTKTEEAEPKKRRGFFARRGGKR